MIKTKKGVVGSAFLVGMIITLAAFVIIAVLITAFSKDAGDKEVELLCRDSIAFRASSMISVDGTLASANIKSPVLCKVNDYKLEGEKEQLMRQIADKMSRCWWMFGEGQYEEILNPGEFKTLSFGTSDIKNRCFVCFSLIIDEGEITGSIKYPQDGKITSREMSEFIRNEKHSKVNKTYLEYFQSHGGPGMVGIIEPEILPRHAYGVSFLAKNKEKKESGWGAILIEGVAGVGISAAGIMTGGIITVTVGGVIAADVVNKVRDKLYDDGVERDVSAIFLDNLKSSQEKCFKGDLGGQ
jgi:hypothetical protein